MLELNSATLSQQVCEHLKQLLNTRQGCLQHLPDYGVPDIYQLFKGLPEALCPFMYQLQQLIARYEPRLSQVQVWASKDCRQADCLQLFISGQLQQQHPIRFMSEFTFQQGVRVIHDR